MREFYLDECPHCGKSVAVFTNCHELEDCVNFESCESQGYCCVVCDATNGGCGASGGYYPSEEEAAASWNSRSRPEEEKPQICPLLSDDVVKQPCIEGPCPVTLNSPLTLEQLRKMEGAWVWLLDIERPEYNGWYSVRPYHDGTGGIELYGVDNNYYKRAIMAGSVKVYARKPEQEA